MLAVTDCGGIIMPPVPTFYTMPASIDEMVTNTVARVLDLFEIETDQVKRWKEEN
jgi:4-hydroxy-3-polyprenylbenzoate decarboxylase